MRRQLAHTGGAAGRAGAMTRKGKPRPRSGPGAGGGGPGAGSPGGGHSPTAKPEAAWKEDTLDGLEKGSRVWVRLSGTAWALATLQGPVGAECLVSLDTGDGLEQVWTPMVGTGLLVLFAMPSCCRALFAPTASCCWTPELGWSRCRPLPHVHW